MAEDDDAAVGAVRPTGWLSWPLVWVLSLALAGGTGWLWVGRTAPWDAPDEPGHYLYAAWLSTRPWSEWWRRPGQGFAAPDLEASILASLAAHGWWRRQGRTMPDPLPTRFAEDPVLAASGIQAVDEPLLFYLLPALLLRRHGLSGDPAAVLPWLRGWSLSLRLTAVVVALLLAHHLWPQRPERGLGLSLWPGLLPMAGFIGSSFSNDSLAMAWGAVGFALLVAHPPARTRRFALTAAWILAGPLVADVSLLYLVGLLGCVLMGAWRYRRVALFGLVLPAVLSLLPVPSWAAGWRREPALARSRWGPALAPTATMWQYLDPKQVLVLRGQPLTLEVVAVPPTSSGRLRLRLVEDGHEHIALCELGPDVSCRLALHLAATATSLRVEIETVEDGATPTLPRVRLHLLDAIGRDHLFNGSGLLSDRLGSPVWTWLERRLPLPAGFFARALAPSAWDTPALFRYLVFIAFTWLSFWGYFGWLSRPLPWPAYGLAGVLTFVAIGGLVRRGLAALHRYRHGLTTPADRLLALALTAMALLLMQVWLPMLGQSWQPQGRYLFPGLLPIGCLVVLGSEAALPPVWRRRLPWLLLMALLTLQAVAL